MTNAVTWRRKFITEQASPPATALSRGRPNAPATPAPQAHSDAEHSVRLTLFGGISIHVGQREIGLKQYKVKSLLAYLALAPGMTRTRDCLIGLLWSEYPEDKARASLRQALHVLRHIFDGAGVAAFSADKVRVSLNTAQIESDLNDTLSSIRSGYLPDCLVNETRITETFMYGYDDTDPSFADWLRVQRESLRQLLIRTLEAQLADRSRPILHVKRIARALCQIDPTHEPACRCLMSAYVETGDVAGALLVYKRLWEHLDNDYDIEPSAATQELVVAIKNGVLPSPTDGVERGRKAFNCISEQWSPAQHLHAGASF
jgi:DNA-binding SARP family transcriptional activator